MDIAGWVEFIAAILIASGLLTRFAAGALVIQMIVGYFDVHLPNGLWPHLYLATGGFGAHGGEVGILYFAMAGVVGVLGSRKYDIERNPPRRVPQNESCGFRQLANCLVRALWGGGRTPLHGVFSAPS